jgi:hypothetical protein
MLRCLPWLAPGQATPVVVRPREPRRERASGSLPLAANSYFRPNPFLDVRELFWKLAVIIALPTPRHS